MDCFLRAFRATYNLLIVLTLLAVSLHIAFAAKADINVSENSQRTSIAQKAPQKQITIIAQHFSSHYSTIAKSLSLTKLSQQYNVVNISLEDWKNQKPKSALIISLGPSPLKELVQSNHQEPVLAALITFQEWKEITHDADTTQSISAIFYDPDPWRQVVLGKLLVPLAQSVGMMYSVDQPFFLQEYKDSAQAVELDLKTVNIRQATQVVRQFPSLAQQSDFFIAQPDPIIYNSQTLPRVLLSSYRQRKIIIGYSMGVVNAGAVATTYTTPEMLVQDLEESANQLLTEGFSRFTRHCNYYDIKYNHEVARSLGLDMVSKEQLQSLVIKLKAKVTTPTNQQGQ